MGETRNRSDEASLFFARASENYDMIPFGWKEPSLIGVLRRDYGDDSTYGAPGPNVKGVHCPCTLGRFVKCLRFIGAPPGLPFSLRSHSHCFSASSADAFFSPTVFVRPFAYVAVTCGSPPRRTSATTSAVAAPTRARNASNRPDAMKSTAPLLEPVWSQYTRRSARSCVRPRMDMRSFVRGRRRFFSSSADASTVDGVWGMAEVLCSQVTCVRLRVPAFATLGRASRVGRPGIVVGVESKSIGDNVGGGVFTPGGGADA